MSSTSASAVNYLTSKAEHDKLIASRGDKLVVVSASAAWCGPCKAIAPRYEEMSKQYRGVTFCKFDTDNVPELSQHYSVRAMPTFFFVKNGKTLDTIKGANVAAIETAIKHHSTEGSAGSAFLGKGNTLSGNAPPGGEGEGLQFGAIIRTVFVMAMLYAWYNYSAKPGNSAEL